MGQRETGGEPVLSPMKSLGHIQVIQNPGEENTIYHFHDPQLAKKRVILYEKTRHFFLFSTTRNIFDWLVSYAWHAGGWNPKYRDTNHYDFENANKGFEYLLKTIAHRDYPWPSRRLIHCQVFSTGGNLVVDWVNRTETLDEDLALLAAKLGVRYTRKEKQRVSRKKKDYQYYYTDSLIELVYETWKQEIRLFGFEFDGIDLDNALIKKEISPAQKEQVTYSLESNCVFLNGRELKN
jgi:hypothetical protein